jgi:hypothetical protein
VFFVPFVANLLLKSVLDVAAKRLDTAALVGRDSLKYRVVRDYDVPETAPVMAEIPRRFFLA